MSLISKLDIKGYRNEAVPNRFFDSNSNQLVIFLPGLAYTNDSPILHYIGSYFLQKELNVLRVDYKYFENEKFLESTEHERKQWLIEDVEAVINTALSERQYERIVLIGKSIGTLALSEILISFKGLINAEVIWLTPLLNDEELYEKIFKINNRSLVILGTADYAYIEDRVEKLLAKENVQSLILKGVNHRLEIENNIIESINISKEIILKIIDFLDEKN